MFEIYTLAIKIMDCKILWNIPIRHNTIVNVMYLHLFDCDYSVVPCVGTYILWFIHGNLLFPSSLNCLGNCFVLGLSACNYLYRYNSKTLDPKQV